MTTNETEQYLRQMVTLLTETLELADYVKEHVIAVNISHALELTIERLQEVQS